MNGRAPSLGLFIRLLVWTVAALGALALFVSLGDWSSVPVRWTDPSGWLNDVSREDAVIELARWLGIVLAAYVAAVAGTGLLAELAAKVQLATLARLLHRLSTRSAAPVLRERLWRGAATVAVSASTLTVSAGGLVGAAAAPAPIELGADDHVETGARDGVDFVGFQPRNVEVESQVDPSVPVVVAAPGDTLWAITEAHYGEVDTTLVAHVATANGISNPGLIAVGQIIALPPVTTDLPDGAATWSTHQVAKSDTLWDILDAHYGYADADLVWYVAAANELDDPAQLAIGQLLTLPPVNDRQSGSTRATDDNSVVTVEVGDSLSRIAAHRLGDADRWVEIWNLNRDREMVDGRVFDDPNLIQPGWTLHLAPATNTTVTSDPPLANDPPSVEAPPAIEDVLVVADRTEPTVEPGPAIADPSTVEASAVHESPPGQGPASDPTPVSSESAHSPTETVVDHRIVVSPMPRPSTGATPTATATQPGDRAATPHPTIADQNENADRSDPISTVATLAAGGLALAGLVALLDRRRRQRRALRPLGHTVARPEPHLDRREQVIRRAARLDIAERVNAAVRSLGPHLAKLPAPLRPLYLLADDATITVILDSQTEPPVGWKHGVEPNSWVCALTDDELSDVAGDWTPWPALIPLGTTSDGSYMLVDLEAFGITSLTGDATAARSVLAALIVSLASSPLSDVLTVLDDDTTALHRLDEVAENRLTVPDVDDLVGRLASWPPRLTYDDRHLLTERAVAPSDCEPCIAAVATTLTDSQRDALRQLNYRTEPIAVITSDQEIGHTQIVINSDHTTALFGHTVTCHHLDPITIDHVADLIEDADTAAFVNTTPTERYTTSANAATGVAECDRTEPTPDNLDHPSRREDAGAGHEPRLPEVQLALDTDDDGPYWEIRDLGDIEIDHPDFGNLTRSRRRELLTLLALQPGGLTAQQLGLMLFPPEPDGELADKSDAAVKPRISELRKALGGGSTAIGHRYLPRADNGRYRAANVRLDSHHLFVLIDAAHHSTDTQHRINALAAALQLVRGPIGRGELTAWAWAGQDIATIEAAIIDAGLELAELATAQQNWKLADWAALRTQLANPYEQRGLPYAIRARKALGDRSGIQRLHATTTAVVDELDPAAADAFHEALANSRSDSAQRLAAGTRSG